MSLLAVRYNVILYKDTVPVKSVMVDDPEDGYDFSADITAPGSYTATVQAVSLTNQYRDSLPSEPSDAKVVA